MLGYISLGTNNMKKATAFYDQLAELVGAKRVWDDENFVAWSNAPTGGISVTKPYNGEPATVGNGVMAAIAAPDRTTVDAIYAKAMSLGATDEGAPGLRGGDDSSFYAGYFRDLDGNKLNAFFMGPA